MSLSPRLPKSLSASRSFSFDGRDEPLGLGGILDVAALLIVGACTPSSRNPLTRPPDPVEVPDLLPVFTISSISLNRLELVLVRGNSGDEIELLEPEPILYAIPRFLVPVVMVDAMDLRTGVVLVLASGFGVEREGSPFWKGIESFCCFDENGGGLLSEAPAVFLVGNLGIVPVSPDLDCSRAAFLALISDAMPLLSEFAGFGSFLSDDVGRRTVKGEVRDGSDAFGVLRFLGVRFGETSNEICSRVPNASLASGSPPSTGLNGYSPLKTAGSEAASGVCGCHEGVSSCIDGPEAVADLPCKDPNAFSSWRFEYIP